MFWTPHSTTPRTWDARFASKAGNRSLISLAELRSVVPPERKPRDYQRRDFRRPGVGAVMSALLPARLGGGSDQTMQPGDNLSPPGAPHPPESSHSAPNPSNSPILGTPPLGAACAGNTRFKGSASLFVLVPPNRPRGGHSELISEPPELILFFSAAQDENLSIKVRGVWKTCYQSTTKPQKVGVLDPPPHHPSYIERAIRVSGR